MIDGETADLFYPIYSEVETIEQNNKKYAVMKLEGIRSFSKQESNIAMGIAATCLTYSIASNNEMTTNSAIAYSALNGVIASQLFATESLDNYFTEKIMSVEINKNTEYTETQIRERVIAEIINSSNKISSQLTYSSNKLGKLDSKLNENIEKMKLKTSKNTAGAISNNTAGAISNNTAGAISKNTEEM